MIDVTEPDLDRFLAKDPGGPVTMLDLLRSRPDGGRERYTEYTRRMSATYGVEVVHLGDGGRALVEAVRWPTVPVVPPAAR